ncbi:AsmA family protein [Candidatus Omnitrophota bacterium]
MKLFNVKGIVILIAVFIAAQIVFAVLISPILGPIVIEAVNKQSGTKISIEKVTVWPLTLSCSLKNMKVFDPDNEKERIALVQKASLKLSLIGLLSKRIVISRLAVSGAEIDLKGEPDGSFNVQKLARPKEAEKKAAAKTGVFDRFRKKKDWFSRIYDMIKQKSSKEAVEKKAAEQKKTGKIERKVEELPHGRRVRFLRPGDSYVFLIKDFVIKNSRIRLEGDSGESVDVDKAAVYIKNLGLDPIAGARLDRLGAEGVLSKNGKLSGSFDLDYSQSFRKDRQTIVSDFSAKNIDLTAITFIYRDSLPVGFEKGVLSINSRTNIVNGALDSDNSITLKDHTVTPRGGRQVVGVIPLPVVCDALNKIDPVEMKFQIAGTVDKPQFKGFEKVLLNLIKPYVANITEDLKKQGFSALKGLLKKKTGSPEESAPAEDGAVSKTIESLKSIFGGQDKE